MLNENINLDTYAEKTWCPGCSNFGIIGTLKNVITSLINEGTNKEDIVVVSGIGCSSKIIDYLNLNTFSSLHGRPISSAQGIKIGNPNLKVIVCAGDGGTYNEGISHLLHAAKRNIDITVLVHNNRTFALTTGQFTATSPQKFKGKSTPKGSVEKPINPLEIVLAANGTFVARGYSMKPKHLESLILKGIKHPGFSFIDILQPCVSFFDTSDFYNEKIYELDENNLSSYQEALNKIREWDYNTSSDTPIPIGLFYKVDKPTYLPKNLKELNLSNEKKVNLYKFLKENH